MKSKPLTKYEWELLLLEWIAYLERKIGEQNNEYIRLILEEKRDTVKDIYGIMFCPTIRENAKEEFHLEILKEEWKNDKKSIHER